MNRTSPFGRMSAWILMAVCFLPVALRAEVQAPSMPIPRDQAVVDAGEAGSASLHRLTGVETATAHQEVRVLLATDGQVTARPFVLESPDRIVVDLQGVTSTLKVNRYELNSPVVSRVRIGQRSEAGEPVARVVIDLNEAQPYRIDPSPRGLIVTIGSQAGGSAAAPTGAPGESDVIFRATHDEAVVAGIQVAPLSTSERMVAGPDGVSPSAMPAPRHEAAADAAAPVAAADSAREAEVKSQPMATPSATPMPPSSATRDAQPLQPSSAAREARPVTAPDAGGVMVAQSAPSTMPARAANMKAGTDGTTFAAKTITPESRLYKGKKISLNLVDADIKQVFRLFHEISGLNFVLDPGVSGNVTIVLDEVPWDQALDIILKNNSLDKVYEDTVIRIATTSKLASEASGRKALKEAKELEVEPITITRRLSYAKAKDVDSIIKTGVLLSQRGKSFFDDRTNTLIITDVPSKIEPVDRLISDLDAKTPQVLIEARIVLTGRDFIQDLGIDWGFQFDRNPPRDFSNANNFPHHGDISYGLHLPRAAAANRLAFNLFNRTGSFALQVALDALEIDGRSRTLSAPKIATQNNVKAEIEQGVQIPIANSTATEINVEFVSASLKLSVTPQITAEGTVIMDVTVENNQPSKTLRLENGIPGIDTQRAQTKVMVEDGGTTVIGGIFSVNEGRSETGVPWFKSIPGLGWLFKSRNITIQNRELLIFITPKILKSSTDR